MHTRRVCGGNPQRMQGHLVSSNPPVSKAVVLGGELRAMYTRRCTCKALANRIQNLATFITGLPARGREQPLVVGLHVECLHPESP